MAPSMMRILEKMCGPKPDPVFAVRSPEPPEEDRVVWRARCSACDFVIEETESIARHDGQKHRQETGHYVWLCFDLLSVGSGWL